MLSSYRLWRVLTGTNMEAETFKYFPNSDYLYFDGYPNMNAALLNGVIDAYLGDEPALKSIHADAEADATLVRVGGKHQVPCLFIGGKPMYESLDIIDWLAKEFA